MNPDSPLSPTAQHILENPSEQTVLSEEARRSILGQPPPRDLEELFLVWGGYIRAKAVQFGIRRQEAEDFESEVYAYFQANDSLGHYWRHNYPDGDTSRPPRIRSFRTYLHGYLWKRAFSFRRDTARALSALLRSPDRPAARGLEGELTAGEVDPAFAREDPLLEYLASRSELAAFLDWLEEHHPRLHEVCFHIVLQTFNQEYVSRWRIAQDMGISEPLVNTLIVRLRQVCREYGFLQA